MGQAFGSSVRYELHNEHGTGAAKGERLEETGWHSPSMIDTRTTTQLQRLWTTCPIAQNFFFQQDFISFDFLLYTADVHRRLFVT